jgi:integral membrane protein (TIGR01906 family)
VRIFEFALFAIAFAVVGLVTFAIAWSGEEPYRDLARENHVDRFVFVLQPPLSRHEMSVEGGVILHGQWSRYVTGAVSEPPRPSPALFTEDEYKHMSDVRRVFDGAKLGVIGGLVVIIVRLQRARARASTDMWRLVRVGTLAAAAAVVLIGLIAIVAFEPLFLAFHYVFFPQGNFLFDPATSNLVRLYPDWYWEGMTARIGVSFIALALALAGLATVRLRGAK